MTHFDTSYWAVSRLADPKYGVFGINYRQVSRFRVPCDQSYAWILNFSMVQQQTRRSEQNNMQVISFKHSIISTKHITHRIYYRKRRSRSSLRPYILDSKPSTTVYLPLQVPCDFAPAENAGPVGWPANYTSTTSGDVGTGMDSMEPDPRPPVISESNMATTRNGSITLRYACDELDMKSTDVLRMVFGVKL